MKGILPLLESALVIEEIPLGEGCVWTSMNLDKVIRRKMINLL